MKCIICNEKEGLIHKICKVCWAKFMKEHDKTGIGISRWIAQNAKEHSYIFTNKELEVIEARKRGEKSDSTGIFAARIKPKIEEMKERIKDKNLMKLIEKYQNKQENKK